MADPDEMDIDGLEDDDLEDDDTMGDLEDPDGFDAMEDELNELSIKDHNQKKEASN